MLVDFSKLEVLTIDGEPIKEKPHKMVAACLYAVSRDELDLVDIALEINKGNPVEVRDSDLDKIKAVIKNPQSGLYAFAIKAVCDFIDEEKSRAKDERKRQRESAKEE